MKFSLDTKNIQGVLYLEVTIGEETNIFWTPLDGTGMDLLLEDVGEFIEDAMWDVTSMTVIEDGEDGLTFDLYKGKDDPDPINETFYFDDYL